MGFERTDMIAEFCLMKEERKKEIVYYCGEQLIVYVSAVLLQNLETGYSQGEKCR
jgi:hypothetical protein